MKKFMNFISIVIAILIVISGFPVRAEELDMDYYQDVNEENDMDFIPECETVPSYGAVRTSAEAITWVKSQVGESIAGGQCVDLIKAYYNYLGYSLGSIGVAANLSTWSNAVPANSGWQRIKGAAPQSGDILVYTGGQGGAGHAAIFESTYSIYHQNHQGVKKVVHSTFAYNDSGKLGVNYWGVIRPSFYVPPTNPLLQLPIANITSNETVELLKNSDKKPVGTKLSNVELRNASENNLDVVWIFSKQSDGSYLIYNYSSKKVMTVSGTNVIVSEYVGGNNQKWVIRGRWNGEYVLSPKSNSNMVLDVADNGSAAGTNIRLTTYYGSDAQKFAISKVSIMEIGTLLPTILMTVFYDVNGGDVLSNFTKDIEIGGFFGELPTPYKKGHLFEGWYTTVNSGGIKITPTTKFNGTITTLYARWSPDPNVAVDGYRYRFYNPATGDHVFLATKREGLQAGYLDDKVTVKVAKSGTKVYQLYNNRTKDHIYTTDKAYGEYVVKQNIGYAFDYNGNAAFFSGGSTPVYSFCVAGRPQHLYTASLAEGKAAGYTLEYNGGTASNPKPVMYFQ